MSDPRKPGNDDNGVGVVTKTEPKTKKTVLV